MKIDVRISVCSQGWRSLISVMQPTTSPLPFVDCITFLGFVHPALHKRKHQSRANSVIWVKSQNSLIKTKLNFLIENCTVNSWGMTICSQTKFTGTLNNWWLYPVPKRTAVAASPKIKMWPLGSPPAFMTTGTSIYLSPPTSAGPATLIPSDNLHCLLPATVEITTNLFL